VEGPDVSYVVVVPARDSVSLDLHEVKEAKAVGMFTGRV
jgi:hypothetical protein